MAFLVLAVEWIKIYKQEKKTSSYLEMSTHIENKFSD